MVAAHGTTSFDQLSVGQPPPPSKPEPEIDSSAAVSDDWRRGAALEKGGGRRKARRGGDGVAAVRRGRRDAAAEKTSASAEGAGFVGLMQQLSVDGRELFELAERGHFDPHVAAVMSTQTVTSALS